MYQSAFLEHRIDRESFRAEEPRLRAQLLEAQLELVERRGFPVLILVTGMDGAGKGSVIQRWNIRAFPTFYVIDAKGVLRAKVVGGGDDNEKKLSDTVDKLVKEAGAK